MHTSKCTSTIETAVYENRTYGGVRGRRLVTASYSICFIKNSGLLSGDPDTVDDEDITVDVGRFIAGQEQCGVGDALRRAWFWCGRQYGLYAAITVHVRHTHGCADLGFDPAGRDSIAADALWGIHEGRVFGHGDEGCLGGAVYGAGNAAHATDRGDVDDGSSALLFGEDIDRFAHRAHRTVHVGLHHTFIALILHITDRA